MPDPIQLDAELLGAMPMGDALPPPPPMDDVIEMPDGSAIVPDMEPRTPQLAFDGNLCDVVPETTLIYLADELLDLIEKDKKAREKRDKQYEEGLKRTGLGNDAPGGARFTGASRAVHPVLAEGCVDFSSRAIKELFPAKGPVKTHIEGKASPDKLKKAQRKQRFMNWQLTKQVKAYRPELEQLLTQVPLGGSQYLKFWQDTRYRRPDCEFVPVDKVHLPLAASGFYTAQRRSYEQDITRQTFESRIRSGLYRDYRFADSGDAPEPTASEAANAKIEGKDDADAYNDDGLRRVYEVDCFWEVDEDGITGGELAPYIIHIDEYDKKVLGIYRNWEQDDPLMERLDWVVEFGFIPWRGAYHIGLLHLIGSLAGSATGALRALLDAAHIANSQTALILKGTRVSGQTTTVEPTQLQHVEAPAGVDDIRKAAMQMPFPPPNPVLMQLMEYCVSAAKGVVNVAEEKIADATNNMPVGTALALIEQGSQVFSAIHGRLHAAQTKCFEILHRLNKVYLTDEDIVRQFGEPIVSAQDFDGPMDVAPVSDPNIFSEAQRYAQFQAEVQLSKEFSEQNWNRNALARKGLELLKETDVDTILPEPPKPKPMDPVSENVAALAGQQLMAFPGQDHLAHLEVHLRFLSDPVFVGSKPVAMKLLPSLLDNIKQHLGFLYQQEFMKIMQGMQVQIDPQSYAPAQMEQFFAAASATVHESLQARFQHFGPYLQQALAMLEQLQPPVPQDPTVLAAQAAMAETERKAKKDDADVALEADQNAKEYELAQEKLRQDLMTKQNELLDLIAQIGTDRQTLELEREKLYADILAKAQEVNERAEQVDQRAMQVEEKAGMMQNWQPPEVEAPDFSEGASQLQQIIQAATAQQQQLQNQQAMQTIMEGLSAVIQSVNKPKMILRGPDGTPIGIAPQE